MRYPPEYKAAARVKLIEAGGALAKQEGFNNTGMDALTAAAGVTTGAFYSQFKSKAELLHAIVDHELSRTLQAFSGKNVQELQRVLGWYLSPRHAAHPEDGCPIPALGPEIARADDATRLRFEELLRQLADTLEPATTHRNEAWAILAQAVGAVVLARAVLNPETQDEILGAVQAAALLAVKDKATAQS